ncbi:MAG: ankyrin repeat domain-containing protein, partial [Candidatus Acidiferrales bacterium]
MNKIFWAVVALDAAVFLILLVRGLMEKGHSDGGREMGLAFYVILPAVFIVLAVLLYVRSSSMIARWLALVIVAGPGLLIAGVRVWDAYLSYSIRQESEGTGYFAGSEQKELGAAVVHRDLAAVQKLARSVDVNAAGKNGMTFLSLAMEEEFGAEWSKRGMPSELPIVRELLASGANPNPGLDTATKTPDPEFMRALLAAGADPNLRVGNSPVVFNWLTVIPIANFALMAEHGLDLNSSDPYGTPLVQRAAESEKWEIVVYLIE